MTHLQVSHIEIAFRWVGNHNRVALQRIVWIQNHSDCSCDDSLQNFETWSHLVLILSKQQIISINPSDIVSVR